MWVYDVENNAWAKGSLHTDLFRWSGIAGAVDLTTDTFYSGDWGASSGHASYDPAEGRRFKLVKYNAAIGTVSPDTFTDVGYIVDPDENSAINGDLAFDADGNMFLVQSTNNLLQIWRVNASALAAASGGEIAATKVGPLFTQDDAGDGFTQFNGIALDNNGHLYLGTNTDIYEVDLADPTDLKPTNKGVLSGSQDLASCAAPDDPNPPPPPTPIPTLSQWGLLLLESLMGGLALLRRRKQV